MLDAQQRRDGSVALGLLDNTVAGVDQDHRNVSGGRAGDRVARVLHVARGVSQDERSLGRGEVAVGDVDRDALLAFGAQAVDEQGQVGALVAATFAGRFDGGQLIGQHSLGVVQQSADERRLAVIDRSGRDDPKKSTRH